MLRKVLLVFLTMCSAVALLFIASKNAVGDHVISLEEPLAFRISVIMTIVLFLPPLILSFFNHPLINIINLVYQSFIVLTFIGLMPIGFMIQNGMTTTLFSFIGTILSVFSIWSIYKYRSTHAWKTRLIKVDEWYQNFMSEVAWCIHSLEKRSKRTVLHN